ncbi:MAG: hypothetical protein L3K26_03060 [Candidatus Hydrogenedentes bacterium]|nr:hypothetical protein [Candidatus Hydrogenedentota bacterium]
MDFKVGLSAKPKKDAAIAKVASEGEKNLKDALKEVLDEIGMCIENARLIDQRVKEMAGKAAFEIEKKLAEAGNARVTRLACSLGFDVELDEDEPDDEEAMASLGESETEDSADGSGDSDASDDDDGDFSFDDDDDGDDDKSDDGDNDDDDDDDDDAFSFDDDDGDDDDDFSFD